MGMGKTVATLTTLDALELIDPGPTLVLAPKRVAQSTWPDEALKWAHLRNIEVCPIIGNLEERKAALRKPANVFTINYEQLPWLVEHLGRAWPFRKIVADESTRLKSFRTRQGGSRAKTLGKVAHKHATRFIELTGTPSPNGLQDLWGQMWFIDQGERLGRTFKGFTDRWFVSERVGADPHAVKLVPMACAQEQIHARLKDVCLSLNPKDYFDLEEMVVNHIRVELPKKARQLYRDMEREMFMQLSGSDIEAVNAADKTVKCLQLANGAIYIDDKKNFAEVHDVKLQALESIIEEAAGMPVLVAYHFKSDLTRLLRAFPKGRALDEDPRTISDWNAGRIPVLFAHPESAGHGLNLQDGGNIIAVFGHWWKLEDFQQIIERIGPVRQLQAGYKRPVFLHYIIAADTIDEVVMARRESKRGVQDLLLEAMKKRRY
jgi:SNF2 family DNA or RNA helicase